MMKSIPNLDSRVLKELSIVEPYEYNFAFFFEKWTIGVEDVIERWTKKNQYLSVLIPTLYLVLLRCGVRYMKHREPFNLRVPLVVWSAILAVFSTLGAIRMVPNVFYVVKEYGLRYSMCLPVMSYGVPSFWIVMFVFSKTYELGDTFFIVARKQRLIFLHWYHHVTVLMYAWWCYMDQATPAYWYCAMNYTVHAFMYTYYTFRALRIHLPRWVSVSITSLQITQMIAGLATCILCVWYQLGGLYCQVKGSTVTLGLLMYGSYFVLFIHFFYNTYLVKKHPKHRNHQPDDVKKGL